MTLDDLMPEFHAVEVHETVVDAPLERIHRTFRELDLDGSVLGWLFAGYWTLVRHGSGLTRRDMLRGWRRRAEGEERVARS